MLSARSLFLALLLCACAVARGGDLPQRIEPQWQSRLQELVRGAHWGAYVEEGELAVALVIVSPGGDPALAMVNGEGMMYAASLPKLAILFGVLVAEQEGHLLLDEALLLDLHAMIRTSCNPCATRALDRLGRERLLEILQRPEYGFYSRDNGGGLWVGKDYSGAPAHARDPLNGLSHGASAYQTARLLYRLQSGDLLPARHTRLMMRTLSRPAIQHKFVAGLAQQQGVTLRRKSGTWRDFHADAAIIDYPGGRYILVGLAEHPDGEALLQALAQRVHQLVLDGTASGVPLR